MEMNDELLIKFLLKESTADENMAVREWLALSETNQTDFAQFEKIWLASRDLNSKSDVNVDLAWNKFKSKVTAQPVIKQLKPKYTWLRIAAILVVAIGAWTVYTVFGPQSYIDVNANKEVLSQTLPDGSELTLNKFSHISYANNFKKNRSIHLDSGDVFFSVAKDKTKPFIIKIDHIVVEVVGTSFNIKHLNQQTEIVVETGIVKVSLGNEEIKLFKGERVTISAGNYQLHKIQTDDQLYNYYRSKLFLANNTPLPKLVAILNEAYGSNIRLNDDTKKLTITTTLQFNKSLDYNIEIICQTLINLKAIRNQNEILLSY
jgi:transmembrane sensor